MIRRFEPVDTEAAVVRLSGQVDELEHAAAELTAGVRALRGDVDAHSRTLADLADLFGAHQLATPTAPDRCSSAATDLKFREDDAAQTRDQ